MNTGFRGALPMYDIFGCASDFAHNFRHLMPTTLNCGATQCTANPLNPPYQGDFGNFARVGVIRNVYLFL